MKKLVMVFLLVALVVGAMAIAGCGEKSTGTKNDPAHEKTVEEPVTEPDTSAMASPQEVANAFCLAVIGDDFETAGSYWDSERAGSLTFSTNHMEEVVSLSASGSGDEQQVEVKVNYTECESGVTADGTIDFTLARIDGLWKIVKAEADYIAF